MAVSTTHTFVRYAGTGTAAPYPITFQFLDPEEVLVTYTDDEGNTTELSYGVDYAVTGGDGETGQATFTETYDADELLRIYRSTQVLQEAALVETGQFSPGMVERQLDRTILILQEIGALSLGSCYRVDSESDAPAPVDASSPANKVLGYDAQGNFTLINRSDIGAQGSQGFQGHQGSQGSQGHQGFQGFTGSQGAQGLQGSQGFQGNQGTQGFQGSQGAAGGAGAQGQTGAQGGTGEQGEEGPQGDQGDPGEQGHQGAQGEQGNQGEQGSQGATGDAGAQGSPGAQGSTGETGGTGPQGDKGAIIKSRLSPTGYARLTCIEAPETRFEDVQVIALSGGHNTVKLPVQFVEACRPNTILLSGIVAHTPNACATGFITGDSAYITTSAPTRATVTYTGIRDGFGKRFEPMTETQYEQNLRFWSEQYGQLP